MLVAEGGCNLVHNLLYKFYKYLQKQVWQEVHA